MIRLALTFMFCVLFPFLTEKKETYSEVVVKPLERKDSIELSNEFRIIKVLSDSCYTERMQQIILAQAKYESGNFKNSLAKKHNNIFAMLHSKNDPYSLGNWGYAEGRKGYAVYKTLEESVYARMWYQKRKEYPMDVSIDEYVNILYKKKYFIGDPKLTAKQNIKIYKKGLIDWIEKDKYIFEYQRKKINS